MMKPMSCLYSDKNNVQNKLFALMITLAKGKPHNEIAKISENVVPTMDYRVSAKLTLPQARQYSREVTFFLQA